MIEAAQVRRGNVIEIDGELYRCLEQQLVKMGRGGANVNTKLRNLSTGATISRTFGSNERLQDVRLESHKVQYLYNDGAFYHFMDLESFEQPALPASAVEDVAMYLVENMELQMAMHDGQPLSIELPVTVDLAVEEAPPGFKGDTASGGGKPVTLANGLTVTVPFFIDRGDVIRIDTRTGEYVTRVEKGGG